MSERLFTEMEDVLRVTKHIPERDIRARYIVTDLRLRGYEIVRPDSAGRLICPTCEGDRLITSIEDGREVQNGCDRCGGTGHVGRYERQEAIA